MLIRDLKYEFKSSKKYLLFIFAISFIFLLDSIVNNKNPIEYYLLVISRDMGMVYDLRDFVLPFAWLIFHLLPIFSILDIIYKDHNNNGIYIMLKAKGKREYFFSKLIASSLLISCIFVSIIIMFNLVYYIVGGIKSADVINLVRIFISYLLEDLVLLHIGLLIAIILSERISLVVILINLCIAMFTNLKFIIGQGSLVMKQDIFGGEFTFGFNILVIITYICIYLILIYLFSPKYNYYGSKND
ncbi:MAG: hypothetical protein SOZ89_04890 [Peptoniphilaceae bacterium]|nr:hypothetical protein [Peptoniphilaceae bacterium]MDD7383218.1 hypothetical protein [Peptoniphilaceae bacterium]MDY3738442.1 hypothetical protein [Peptoniphilaceae bacterium]